MATLQSKVEDYVGTYSDTEALTNWLTQGARILIDLLPLEKLEKIATSANFTNSIALAYKKPLYVHVGGYEARDIPLGRKTQAAASGSIYYATATDPVSYVEGSNLSILPAGTGTLVFVAYPIVSYNDTYVSLMPIELEQIVVLYTAIQCQVAKMLAKNVLLTAISPASISAIAAVTAPSFTYTDAALGTYINALIGDFGTAPVYNPTLPADLSALSITLSLPTTVATPSFTVPVIAYSDIAYAGALSISAQYSTLTTLLNTSEDIELAQAKINEIQAKIADWNTNANAYMQRLQITGTEQSLRLQKELQEYQSKIQKFQADLQSVELGLRADLEEYNANTASYNANVQKNIQDGVNDFNKDVVAYNARVQKEIQQAQLIQQSLLGLAEATTNLHLANEAKDLEKQVQEYASKLQKFQLDLQSYSAQVQQEGQRINFLLQQYSQGYKQELELLNTLKAEYNQLLQLQLGLGAKNG